MKQEEINNLIDRYLEGEGSPEEALMLNSYFNELAEKKTASVEITDLDERQQRVWNQINARMVEKKRIRLWPHIAATAAAVTAITLGVWFYVSNQPGVNRNSSIVSRHDIAPGKNGATITLANGKVIQLSDLQSGVVIGSDKLVYSDGTTIASEEMKSVADEQLTASTTKGQTYIFTLPDGTKVWLNADSKLTFAHQFVKNKRSVFLQGEAYFEVVKDKTHPFMVITEDQEVEVLGTHFNVNSYEDEGAEKTTLVEGSVRVRQTGTAKNEVVLIPGQQATNDHKNLMTSYVKAEEVLDWKNDGFAFNGGDFAAAMRKIARWYNVEIIYDPVAAQKMEIGGFISRKNELSEVLKFIESTEQVKFTIEGRRVLVRN